MDIVLYFNISSICLSLTVLVAYILRGRTPQRDYSAFLPLISIVFLSNIIELACGIGHTFFLNYRDYNIVWIVLLPKPWRCRACIPSRAAGVPLRLRRSPPRIPLCCRICISFSCIVYTKLQIYGFYGGNANNFEDYFVDSCACCASKFKTAGEQQLQRCLKETRKMPAYPTQRIGRHKWCW